MKLKHTTRKLNDFGRTLILALRKELKQQQHIASGDLLRSFKSPKAKNGVLNITSSVAYWKAVNNPKFAKKYNYNELLRWVKLKRIPVSAVGRILNKLKNKGYGKPYVYWSEGNTIERTDFAGIVAKENSQQIGEQLAQSIGDDVADMIRKELSKVNTAQTT